MAAIAVVVILVVVAVAGVVLVVRGRGGDADLTASEMRAALLTEEDLGDGFTEEDLDDDDDDDDDLDPDDLDTSEECRALLSEYEDGEAIGPLGSLAPEGDEDRPSAEVKFSGEDDAVVQQGITLAEGDALGAVREVAETCDEIGYEIDGDEGEIRFSLGEPLDLGDESETVEIEIAADGPVSVTIEFVIAVWARDGILSTLSVSSGFDEGFETTDPDVSLLEDLAEEADARLEQVIDEDG